MKDRDDEAVDRLTVTPTWLTPEQAAAYLQLSERTLQDWRTKKTGPPFGKRGQIIRYHREDLDTWLRNK